MWEAAGIVNLANMHSQTSYSPTAHERNVLFEGKKRLPKNVPMHLNQQLAAPLEDFCAKLLGNWKEFTPEIVSYTTT